MTATLGLPAGSAAARAEWPLDPAIAYLNHGGYGVAPNAVLARQACWRRRIEANPMQFITRELAPLWRQAAAALAAHLGARGEDLAFVANATAGCNAVLRSLAFKPGDEILVTSLAYGAIAKAVRYVAAVSGATVITAEIPLPLIDGAAIGAAIAAKLGPRTRLVVLDHIASASALVLPVAELTRLAHQAGARVLIDGAHAPGQVSLDLPATGADWYVGNCHKWLMAPRGCGFLWAPAARQAELHPLAISHGYGQGFLAEFDWTGTIDPTPFLSVPDGIACHTRFGGPELMARNHRLAIEAARLLAARWGTALGGPEDCFAAMATVRLPLAETTQEAAVALQRRLAAEHRIEAAIVAQAGALWVRVAAQAYNRLADYERLAAVL
jgi:isopenicillin-N epimerase